MLYYQQYCEKLFEANKNKEKLKPVEEINNYFDSNNRELIKEKNEIEFKDTDLNARGKNCVCRKK